MIFGWVLLSLITLSGCEPDREDAGTNVEDGEEEEIVSKSGLRGGIRMKKRKTFSYDSPRRIFVYFELFFSVANFPNCSVQGKLGIFCFHSSIIIYFIFRFF